MMENVYVKMKRHGKNINILLEDGAVSNPRYHIYTSKIECFANAIAPPSIYSILALCAPARSKAGIHRMEKNERCTS